MESRGGRARVKSAKQALVRPLQVTLTSPRVKQTEQSFQNWSKFLIAKLNARALEALAQDKLLTGLVGIPTDSPFAHF